MSPDDLYPQDSSYFGLREPEGQSIERKKKRAQTLEALPILQDLLKRIDEKIDFYRDTRSIADDYRTNEKEFMALHTAHAKLAEGWQNEREWIESLLETAGKR